MTKNEELKLTMGVKVSKYDRKLVEFDTLHESYWNGKDMFKDVISDDFNNPNKIICRELILTKKGKIYDKLSMCGFHTPAIEISFK